MLLHRKHQHDTVNGGKAGETLTLPAAIMMTKESTTTTTTTTQHQPWNNEVAPTTAIATTTTPRVRGNFITKVGVCLFVAMIVSFVRMMNNPLVLWNSDGTLSINSSSGSGSNSIIRKSGKKALLNPPFSPNVTKEQARTTTTTIIMTNTTTPSTTTLPPPNSSMSEPVTTTPIITATTTTTTATTPRFHIVLSTGCSTRQNWQSFVSMYHLLQSGQTGDVTRIASGCTTQEGQELQEVFHQQVQELLLLLFHHRQEKVEGASTRARGPSSSSSSGNSSSSSTSLRFHLHLTPDYSTVRPGHSYLFFNKAFGMKHWMEHGLGYNSMNDKYYCEDDDTTRTREPNEHDDTIIILLDPDQLVLKPFTQNYTDVQHLGWVRRADQNENSVVQRGTSITQLYGFGEQWYTKINLTRLFYANDDDDSSTKTLEYPESETDIRSSALWNVTEAQQLAYAAGPPYLAVARDMYQIVHQWVAFAPRVHVQYPWLISEMFAYSLAAVHVRLPPRTVTGFMVSDAYSDASSEGWWFLEDKEKEEDTAPTTKDNNITTATTATADHQDKDKGAFQCLSHYQRQPRDRMPYVLHYCQDYFLGKWFFSKTMLPDNFISCASPLLREPKSDDTTSTTDTDADSANVVLPLLPPLQQLDYGLDRYGTVVDFKDNIQLRQRQAWILCTILSAMNQAATFYKHHFCSSSNGTATTTSSTNTTGFAAGTIANYSKTLVFHWNFTM
jgi:peptidyl serine alpha-galactosyltransferase